MLRVAHAASRELRRRGGRAQVVSTLSASAMTVDQVGLTASARRVNVTGAFVAKPAERLGPGAMPHVDRSLIIVDDITTTGATLAEARRALISAGWSVRGSAVVAQTVARRGVAGSST